MRGVDPDDLPPARLLNAFWAWLIEMLDPEQIATLRAELWADVPASETGRPANAPAWWDEEDGFTDAMSKDAGLR